MLLRELLAWKKFLGLLLLINIKEKNMARLNINLTKILIDSEKISEEELDKALVIQKKTGKNLKNILIEEGFLTEDDLLSLISYLFFMPYVDSVKFKVDPAVVDLIPEDTARRYNLFPLYKFEDSLLIAVSEPLDIFTLDNLRLSLGCEIKQVLSRGKRILDSITAYYTAVQTLPEILETEEPLEIVGVKNEEGLESIDLIEESKKQPIVKAVRLILNEAIERKASDIHLEPTEEDLRVRYRIDGILREAHSIPKKSLRGVSARIKIISNLNITKSYLPQDGRFHMVTQGKEIDFRVSSLPTIFGEKFVLRILDKAGALVKLEDLGYSEQPLGLLMEAISKDHGMILITGPTGSGKSTTLYSILNKLNTVNRHIITVEEPVEYQIEGLTQIQIRPEIDLSFLMVLRGLLRQSPDTIMIGEIRDMETADMAIKSSLIGQLIFSTLHTNDSISAFARLIDMGIERYLVASSLILICAQRLCRKICNNCKEPVTNMPQDILVDLGINPDDKQKFFRGKGCDECNKSGYKGRTALLEALKVDDQIKAMVINEIPLEQIREWAIKEGRLITLRIDGLTKAFAGITSIEEIYRVTARD